MSDTTQIIRRANVEYLVLYPSNYIIQKLNSAMEKKFTILSND